MVVDMCGKSKVLTKNTSSIKSRGKVNGNWRFVALYARKFNIFDSLRCHEQSSSFSNSCTGPNHGEDNN